MNSPTLSAGLALALCALAIDQCACQTSTRMLRGLTCNAYAPCPSGYACMSNPYSPGTKNCFRGVKSTARKAGRCPPVASGNPFPDKCGRCMFDSDCGGAQRCCRTADGRLGCTQPLPVDTSQNTVTPLIVGSMSGAPPNFVFHGACTLVQSGGKNIVVDTGPVGDGPPLLDALGRLGYSPDDVDMVFTTHGHPDHYSNNVYFPDADNHFSGFSVTGPNYKGNPLLGGAADAKMNLYDNPDLEVINTPGHTPQDTTLFVKNVPGKGTVSVAGDCVLTKAFLDTPPSDETYQSSLRAIVCNSDYIVPGHDAMFQVTGAMKNQYCGQ